VKKSPDKERRFSAREARALLWLLPVLAVVSWLIWEASRADGRANDHTHINPDGFGRRWEQNTDNSTAPADDFGRRQEENSDDSLPSAEADGDNSTQETRALARPFLFDPNTVDYHALVRLGFERSEALGIIKFRKRGKVFEIPEDFAACYQVSEEMYRRLAPYIRIGEEFRLKPFARPNPDRDGMRHPERNSRAESVAEPQKILRRPMRTPNDEVDPDVDTPPALIELNTADSAKLISVVGIGERTVVSIMELRAQLGGFASVTQLSEVRGITEQNYERILPQIFVDTTVIQKININFAPAKRLSQHPYVKGGPHRKEGEVLRKLLKTRQLKGGWRTPEELITDDIYTTEELEKLRPYLDFKL
jgi:DNA uptake protein ComE-like DNA-binding protein